MWALEHFVFGLTDTHTLSKNSLKIRNDDIQNLLYSSLKIFGQAGFALILLDILFFPHIPLLAAYHTANVISLSQLIRPEIKV